MTNTDTELITSEIIEAIRDRKGRNITTIDLSGINSTGVAKFIIAEGSSTTQVAAIADNVREQLLERISVKPYNYDGYGQARWIVIDYGDTLVHIFVPDERQRYNLEELWSDGKIETLPDLL